MRFWDSSGLIPLIVEEKGSQQIQKLYKADPEMLVWTLTDLEPISVGQSCLRPAASP